MARILFIDDDRNFCRLIQDFFGKTYAMATALSGAEAIRRCAAERFDLVVCDIKLPDMSGPELVVRIRELLPQIKTALITSYNVDDYIGVARKYGITDIIPKTVPLNFAELEVMISRLSQGDIFGLQRYLLPGAARVEQCEIHSSDEARDVRERLVTTLLERFGSAGDMKLILDEIITNAIYHAPRNPDGTEKYPELTNVRLLPEESVIVEWGFDGEKYGVAVIDRQGKLTKEIVLEKIDRQIAGTGILDDSGRGLHISRMLADRMIINIQRNVKTEVILMNYISKKYQGSKPLYINEL
jgi:CheY-like chemotaxis protein/anti-sigma regulatory factor (Ser/Thr protein kinase)